MSPSPASDINVALHFPPMNILNVGYDSTNYYLLDIHGGKLLVDCGWPGTLPKLLAQLKRKGVSPAELKFLLVSHFHPDHAGLAGELQRLGLKLVQMENQADGIAFLEDFFSQKKEFPFVEVSQKDALRLEFADSRKFLAGLGLDGEILHTPGHSDDSVTLVLGEGVAFTGDLKPLFMARAEDDQVSKASWDKIYRHKITRVLPAHGA